MATGAAAHQAAVINAIKASGIVVRLEPAEWAALVERMDEPLVVVAEGGMFTKHFRYLTSYRGLAFFTKSPQQLVLPKRAELVHARGISVPEL